MNNELLQDESCLQSPPSVEGRLLSTAAGSFAVGSALYDKPRRRSGLVSEPVVEVISSSNPEQPPQRPIISTLDIGAVAVGVGAGTELKAPDSGE